MTPPTVRVGPRALRRPGVAVAVAGRSATPGVAVPVEPGDVTVVVRFDLDLPPGRVRGELTAELSVPDEAALDVSLPLASLGAAIAHAGHL